MTIYLDTETTGLSPPRDEILEIGILDDQGAGRYLGAPGESLEVAWSAGNPWHFTC